jgi:hypothetical protein
MTKVSVQLVVLLSGRAERKRRTSVELFATQVQSRVSIRVLTPIRAVSLATTQQSDKSLQKKFVEADSARLALFASLAATSDFKIARST